MRLAFIALLLIVWLAAMVGIVSGVLLDARGADEYAAGIMLVALYLTLPLILWKAFPLLWPR